jgi:hypothetical protein
MEIEILTYWIFPIRETIAIIVDTVVADFIHPWISLGVGIITIQPRIGTGFRGWVPVSIAVVVFAWDTTCIVQINVPITIVVQPVTADRGANRSFFHARVDGRIRVVAVKIRKDTQRRCGVSVSIAVEIFARVWRWRPSFLSHEKRT